MYLPESVAVDSSVPTGSKPEFDFPQYKELCENKEAFIDFWTYYLYKGLSSQTKKEINNVPSDNVNYDVAKLLQECITVSDEAFALLCIWNEWNTIEKYRSEVRTKRIKDNKEEKSIVLTKDLFDYRSQHTELRKYSSCVFKGSSEGNSNKSSPSGVALGWNDEAIEMYNYLLTQVTQDRHQKWRQRENLLKEVSSKCNNNMNFSIGCSAPNKQAVLPVEHIPQVDGGKYIHQLPLRVKDVSCTNALLIII